MPAPLTGVARSRYLARALASPTPLDDELEKLGFVGASELAASRARLRAHVDSINTAAAPRGGAVSASPKMVNGAVVGGSRVAQAPRLEASGPDRRSASQREADLRRNTDVALSAGLDRSGINEDLGNAAKVTNTAGNIMMGVLNPVPSVTARARGEKVSATDYGLDVLGFLPVLRGPRAVIRAGKALKAGESARAAAKAASASMKEVGPITQAVKKIPMRDFRAGGLTVSVPAAGSRTGRAVERLGDSLLRPKLEKVGAMKTEAERAGQELGHSIYLRNQTTGAVGAALQKVGRRLSDAEEYAIRVVAEGVGPNERAGFHLAQAGTTDDKVESIYHTLHADLTMRSSKYIDMVRDPKRGLVPALKPNAPKNLRTAMDLFDQSGDLRETLLGDLGRLSDEGVKKRAQAPAGVIRGDRWVNPTPGKMGVASDRLQFKRDQVKRLEKKVALAEAQVNKMEYFAADLKKTGGSVSIDPNREERLQAQLNALNKAINDIRGRKPKPGEDVVPLIEERKALKRLEKFRVGLQQISEDYSAEAKALSVSAPGGSSAGAEDIAGRIEDLNLLIEALGGKIPYVDLGEIGREAQRIRNQLKIVRANPQSIQWGTRIITPSGDIITPKGQARLDRARGALSVARDMLQEAESAAAKRVAPSGLIGGAYPHEGVGKSYAPMWRGMPVSGMAGVQGATSAYFRRASALFGGKAIGAGPDDIHLRKQYRGSLLLSGFFAKDVVGPKVESMMVAVRMSSASVARRSLLQAAKPIPSDITDIAIRIDPRKPVGYAEKAAARQSSSSLNAYYDALETLEAGGGKLTQRDLRRVDFDTTSAALEEMFPGRIGDTTTAELAAQMIDGMKDGLAKPIPNIAWVPREFLDQTGLLYVPSASRLAQSGMSRRAIAGKQAIGISADGLNDFQKAILLYLNPAYAPVNLVGNLAMNTMQQGVFLPKNLMDSVAMHRNLEIIDRVHIDRLMGHGMTAALSMRTTPGQAIQATLGKWIGVAVDLVPRRAAFLHEARMAGYNIGGKRGKGDLAELLAKGRSGDEGALSILDAVSRKANDAIVDFERMSPFERETVSKWIFFYPWLNGASRYAVRFAADHPIQAVAIALAYEHSQAAAQDLLGDRPYYAQMQIPLSTKSLGLKIPGTSIDVGLDQVAGERTWKDGSGNPMTLNIRQLFTQSTPLELLQAGIAFAGVGNDAEAAQGVAQMLTPVPYAAAVSLFGYDPFTKKKVDPGISTFFNQFGPENTTLWDRITQLNMSPAERRAYQKKALNPRSREQEWQRMFGSGLAPAPYATEVGQQRALEGKSAFERQSWTLIHDSKHAGMGNPPPEVMSDLKLYTDMTSKLKRDQSDLEHAIIVATFFDKKFGGDMVATVKGSQTEGEAEAYYKIMLESLYPNLSAWRNALGRVQDAKASMEPAGG